VVALDPITMPTGRWARIVLRNVRADRRTDRSGSADRFDPARHGHRGRRARCAAGRDTCTERRARTGAAARWLDAVGERRAVVRGMTVPAS